MKKINIILALLAFLPFSRAFAQVGEIIYRDFEPDSVLEYHNTGYMLIDLDGKGLSDIKMGYYINSPGIVYTSITSLWSDSLEICGAESNSVLSEIEQWYTFLNYEITWEYNKYGFRFKHDNGYIYGWFETHRKNLKNNEARAYGWVFDRTAYCTIPNYPLVWGQTSLLSIEETEDKAFVTIHPNPTTGIVRIEGENASEVRVFNMLGQVVKTVQNTNEVSLEGLPQGVYLLRITTEGGKVFSDKVVKE